MRRAEREVTDIADILRVIDKCKICRIGIWNQDRVYIVPMNFGYTYEEQVLTFYFHGANKGRKYQAIAANPKVGFELDCEHSLITAKEACGYGYSYASVIGTGTAALIEEPEEKKKALSVLMKQQTGEVFELNDRQASSVNILKITAEEFACKQNR